MPASAQRHSLEHHQSTAATTDPMALAFEQLMAAVIQQTEDLVDAFLMGAACAAAIELNKASPNPTTNQVKLANEAKKMALKLRSRYDRLPSRQRRG